MSSKRVATDQGLPRALLVGLLGAGISHSRSFEIHEAEATALGFPLVYRSLDTDALTLGNDKIADLLDWAKVFGFAGLNVTHPYKQHVVQFMDDLSAEAVALDAVNTIIFTNGSAIGHNTDWSGYARSFTSGLPDAPLDRVCQIGAGGAGSAVAYALLGLGVSEFRLFDINHHNAEELAGRLARLFPDRTVTVAKDLRSALDAVDGLVQATPIGMVGHPGSPLPANLLRPELWVSDLVYTPPQTELLIAARELGCATINGSGMVVQQAADAFALFTGREPDIARMLKRFHGADASETKASPAQ